jgi:hypothetical protein
VQARGIPYDLFTAALMTTIVPFATARGRASPRCSRAGAQGKSSGAVVVHAHAGELLAERTMAKKFGLSLTKLGQTIHVYPTLSEGHRALGNAYLLRKATPTVRKILRPVFAWLRGNRRYR